MNTPLPFAVVVPIVSTITMLLGLGVLWGVLKTQVGYLREQVDRLVEQLDRQEHALAGLQEELRVKFAQHQAAARPAQRNKRRK